MSSAQEEYTKLSRPPADATELQEHQRVKVLSQRDLWNATIVTGTVSASGTILVRWKVDGVDSDYEDNDDNVNVNDVKLLDWSDESVVPSNKDADDEDGQRQAALA